MAEESARVERHGYLFGLKIAASMSPQFHKTIFDALGWPWEQHRLESDDITQFLELLQDPKCFGSSVTMPNKVSIMEHLDEMTEECRQVGACNTIFFRSPPSPPDDKGKDEKKLVIGANTDVIGVRESFYQNVSDPSSTFHDRPALVVGGGGAARSAVYALSRWMRASRIYLVNRDAGEVDAVVRECAARGYGDGLLLHVSTVAQAQGLEAPGAIVACVPDFPPSTPEEHTARSIVETFLGMDRKGAMLEMCYNPTPYTALGALAEGHGWQVILGTEAMIWQGFEQCKLWTGLEQRDLPVAKCKEVIANLVMQRSAS